MMYAAAQEAAQLADHWASAKCHNFNMNQKGQTALEYMLMIAVIFSILVLVVAMTGYIDQIGAGLGGSIDDTRTQVISWIMT